MSINWGAGLGAGGLGMDKSIDEILTDCWHLMEDHDPEGWPAIQMKVVTALCDEVRRLTPKFAIGERVMVTAFEGEFEGEVVSRSQHKSIGDQYAVYAKYPHNKNVQAEWFAEDQLSRVGGKGALCLAQQLD